MAFDAEKSKIPQYKITIDGVPLLSSVYSVISIMVQLSSNSEANSCEIMLLGKFDHSKSCLNDSILDKVKAGSKIQVQLGYSTTSTVFLGYINTVTVNYTGDGVEVGVSCLDARGLLMGSKTWQTFPNQSLGQVITKLLNPIRSFTGGVTVNVPGAADKEHPITKDVVDDYSYICAMAKITGCSFCVIGTKLKFVSNIFKTARNIGNYKWGESIISFNSTIDLSGQIGEVTVTGTDPDTLEEFKATEKAPAVGGKSAGDLCAPIKGKSIEIASTVVKNQKEAAEYAKSMINQSAMRLCTGSCVIVGNQNLVPGSKMRFTGMDSSVDGQYLITGISHNYGAGGFITTISFNSSTV